MLNLHLDEVCSRPLSRVLHTSVSTDSSTYFKEVTSRSRFSKQIPESSQCNMPVQRLLSRSTVLNKSYSVKSPSSYLSCFRDSSFTKSTPAKSVVSFSSTSASTHTHIRFSPTDSTSPPDTIAAPPTSQPPAPSVSDPSPAIPNTKPLTNPQLRKKKTLERSQYAKSYTKAEVIVGSVTACGEARPRVWTPWSVLLGYKDRPSAVLADKALYFAFGSNMGVKKLQSRGGGIKLLAAEPGYVSDHRLAFNVLCLPPVEPSMASMEAEAGSLTHGLLVALERGEYEELYMTEGGSGGEGRCYLEKVVTVTTYEGKELQAVAFQTNPRSPQALPRWLELPPSRRYLNLLIEGATASKVDPAYVVRLKQIRAVFE